MDPKPTGPSHGQQQQQSGTTPPPAASNTSAQLQHHQQLQRPQPAYDITSGGHYGASALLSAQGFAPSPEVYTGTWANVNQGLHGSYRDILATYWQHTIDHLENDPHDYKLHQLPLARIKKVMKADPEVKMISAEAPILFAKGCDIFITELTMRAWIHAEENKRRTLQRSDIASALTKSDMFDFLIDIVPREEAAAQAAKRQSTQTGGAGSSAPGAQGGQGPPQTGLPQQAQAHPPLNQDFSLGSHGMGQEQEYRPQQGMYPGQPGAYGQPPQAMYDQQIEGMYAYPGLPAQQMYHVNQRPDTSVAQDQSHAYQHQHQHQHTQHQHQQRHGAGEVDPDGDGDRDYEVG
ncbi:MAG: hypothetical protein M1829_004515 [Trizodia sp. TS-e1964]|nr:MAG: hypothetical protein M1829_004515 [Trizodia sp. TS-e1964]